ncbi:MAG TPA: SusD/RagB family nutrient-binding outer membrane lipoprotein [Puia sp.]|nr:SusD/RagB family nutrient-binding outer membrane lipoprotein [Puia sp.]
MKINLNSGVTVLSALLLMGAGGCTKNFEDYNTNPTYLSPEQSQSIIAQSYGPLEQAIYADYQTAQNLNADGYAGYFTSPTNFSASLNDQTYTLIDGWSRSAFVDQYNQVMAPVAKIAAAGIPAIHPDMWAVALLIQVDAMDRVTDRFGPIPYSKAGTSFTSVAYDSQKDVYARFFSQIDTAVANLKAYIAANPGNTSNLATGDLVYKGDYVKWLKFANSLRLRLAMRIVKADAATAQAQGETALSDAGGLMTSPADDAKFAQSGGRNNDVWLVSASYGDNRMGAALMTYLTGYNDPRLPVYALPVTGKRMTDSLGAGAYAGIRLGTFVSKDLYGNFSSPNTNTTFQQTASQYLMTAAEVWFLKAEAALRGWKNAGDVKTNYETGVTTSFQQWGVSAGNYLSDATSTEANYKDPYDSTNVYNTKAISTMTIQWDASANNETMLERIITQKWIAVYPDGQEAWADFRRTGYPKLFPVAVNTSGGLIDTKTQIRRLAYPQLEYQTNGAAVSSAVQTLLGGPDNGGTRLWWDVNKGNF